MVLLVETGSVVAGAQSYISVADATTYLDEFASNGSLNAFSAASANLPLQEAALRQATRFLDARYALRFIGQRYHRDQPLQWPRVNAVDNDGRTLDFNVIPPILKGACCEIALRFIEDTSGHVTRRLIPDQLTPGAVKRKRLKADVVETETEWVNGAEQEPYYALADHMLAPILQTSRIALG